MMGQNNLTGSELLHLAQDRQVEIGETYSIGEQSYRMCVTDEGSKFTHQITNAVLKKNLQTVTI